MPDEFLLKKGNIGISYVNAAIKNMHNQNE